jgi:serine O-acetyltransferase
MLKQLRCLLYEISLLVNRRYWRLFTIWFGGSVYINISYRVDRMLYLTFGRSYVVIRPLFFPIFFVCQLLGGRHEIHYRADIGAGLRILHAAMGTVISGRAIIGTGLILVGGNLIGGRKALSDGDIKIGSNVTLGANAVVLGPITLGDNCRVGAGAVVLSNSRDDSVLVGVPARVVTAAS